MWSVFATKNCPCNAGQESVSCPTAGHNSNKCLVFMILLRRFHETGQNDIELLTGVSKNA
jgi:hypothetical protein